MPLSTAQCQQFNSFLGSRPYPWAKKISEDRKPSDYIYCGLYATEMFPLQSETTLLHEKVYVTRPNDPGLWQQFTADPCIGTPCDLTPQVIGHGVDQLRFDRFRREYNSIPFCLDQLNTVDEGIAKLAAIAKGYNELPESICSDFLRLLVLRKCGNAATQSGLWLAGVQDSLGNPQALDISDNMFAVSQGQSAVVSKNSLLCNLNANGGLTALGFTTTALLQANMGQLTMEYLANAQDDLAAAGYHKKEWLMAGKFSITVDATTRRQLLVANPALTQMYSAADFAKGGAFYSYGVTNGCGDWLFKEDNQQMRFRFRGDLDGKNFDGTANVGAIWIEQVWPFVNIAATFGLKPVFSADWKNAPLRLYHAYNRDARTIYVGDIASVNDEMKFGLARSFMGKWTWKSPDFFSFTDPNTGVVCQVNNYKHNRGFFMGEYDLGIKTVYPEIERLILALGEAQPYIRKPNTTTPQFGPTNATDYQSLLAYSAQCGEYNPGGGFVLPPED